MFCGKEIFLKALDFASEAIDGLNDDALGGYRAWWHFLASIAATHLNDRDVEIDHLTRARAIGVYTGFLDELLRKQTGGAQKPDPNDSADHQAENIWRTIDDWGWSGLKFRTNIKRMLDALAKAGEPTHFHIGLELLGNCLGAEALRPNVSGGPDVVWIFSNQSFTFEAKSDKVANGKLFKKELQQAKGHPDWLKNERPSLADMKIRPVIISPTKNLDAAAEPHAKDLFYISLKQICELAEAVASELTKIRTEFAGKEFSANVTPFKKRLVRARLHLNFLQSHLNTPLRPK